MSTFKEGQSVRVYPRLSAPRCWLPAKIIGGDENQWAVEFGDGIKALFSDAHLRDIDETYNHASSVGRARRE